MSKVTGNTKGNQQNKENSASGSSTRPPKAKRSNTEMANTSAEELGLMQQTLDNLADDMKSVKECLKTLMNREEIETYVQSTVKDILDDFDKNLEFTVATEVDKKIKGLTERLDKLEEENKYLKKENETQKAEIKLCIQRSKKAESMANYNEQYSRKNNIKFMDITEPSDEDEAALTDKICNLVSEKGVTLDRQKIVAIHRIPAKPGKVRPVLVKLQNNAEKSKIMQKRSSFKSTGNRLVDDVTRDNAILIERLLKNPSIDAAWYFNGSVYGKTTADKRHKFDIHDVVSNVIAS